MVIKRPSTERRSQPGTRAASACKHLTEKTEGTRTTRMLGEARALGKALPFPPLRATGGPGAGRGVGGAGSPGGRGLQIPAAQRAGTLCHQTPRETPWQAGVRWHIAAQGIFQKPHVPQCAGQVPGSSFKRQEFPFPRGHGPSRRPAKGGLRPAVHSSDVTSDALGFLSLAGL